MKIYPAIDLKNGRCVRLYKGSFDAVTEYDADPVDTAFRFSTEGARALHVVDLEGAREGGPQQSDLISAIVRGCDLEVQAGGGVRNERHAKEFIGTGVGRLVLGSLAVLKPELTRDLIADFGPDRITLAVDVRCRKDGEPEVASNGWTQGSGAVLWDVIEKYTDLGLAYVLCTDIERDGTLEGPNVSLYASMQKRYPEIEIQASGGIGKLDDIRALKHSGVRAAIVGKALWEGKFTLAEALAC